MNNIFIMSRAKFKEEIKSLTEQQFMATAFISIHEPKNKIIGGYAEPWPVILEESSNVLNLWFNDEDEYNPETESVLFTEEMAKSIKRFVQNNKDKKQWVIHCTMGQCRSGAVGECISDYLGNEYFKFKRDNPQIKPNVHVKKLLNNELEKESNQ